jgi:hypothetical protein
MTEKDSRIHKCDAEGLGSRMKVAMESGNVVEIKVTGVQSQQRPVLWRMSSILEMKATKTSGKLRKLT